MRLPVCFTTNMIGNTLSDIFMLRLTQVTDWCLGRGLICVVAMHASDNNECPLATSEQITSLWGQVSSTLVNRSKTNLVFEILDGGSTDALNIAGVSAVRESSPERIVSISTKGIDISSTE